jgi:hypothetical protein
MPLPKQPLSATNRQPQGIPAGGQFAPNAHAEPSVSLSAEKGFFTEADNDPDIMANASRFDGDTGDDPTHDLLAGGGSGNQPPSDPAVGAGGGGDDEQRKDNQAVVTRAAKVHEDQLSSARFIYLSTNHRGNIRVDGVENSDGNSSHDRLVGSLNVEINGYSPRGEGLPASHIIGDQKTATVDAQELIKGKIKIVSLPSLD